MNFKEKTTKELQTYKRQYENEICHCTIKGFKHDVQMLTESLLEILMILYCREHGYE